MTAEKGEETRLFLSSFQYKQFLHLFFSSWLSLLAITILSNMDLDFEIDGVCDRIKTFYADQKDLPKRRVVTLQFPDGLMAYATTIADQIKTELTVCCCCCCCCCHLDV